MTQVIITTTPKEREECIERLRDMGWKSTDGNNDTYAVAPHIKILGEDYEYQTITSESTRSHYYDNRKISVTKFLSETAESILK